MLSGTGVALAGHYHNTDFWSNGLYDGDDEDLL